MVAWGALPSRDGPPGLRISYTLYDVEGRGEEFAEELGEVVVRAAAAGRCGCRRRDFGARANGTTLGLSRGLKAELA